MDLRTPNAVMMEKSSVDEVDANRLRQGALENLSGKTPQVNGGGDAGAALSVVEGQGQGRPKVLYCVSLVLGRTGARD